MLIFVYSVILARELQILMIQFFNEDVLHNFNIDTDMLDQNNDQNSISIPNRVSVDTKVNNCGRRLMVFCKTFGIQILNGRYGTDKDVGHLTSKMLV